MPDAGTAALLANVCVGKHLMHPNPVVHQLTPFFSVNSKQIVSIGISGVDGDVVGSLVFSSLPTVESICNNSN